MLNGNLTNLGGGGMSCVRRRMLSIHICDPRPYVEIEYVGRTGSMAGVLIKEHFRLECSTISRSDAFLGHGGH